MPGPCNQRKKKKTQAKKARKSGSSRPSLDNGALPLYFPCNPSPVPQPSPITEHYDHFSDNEHEGIVPHTPYIHDPGNGPRVRDTRAFLSSFFAQPPSLDDPLCAEFAQEEVCQMLFTVLPEETALVNYDMSWIQTCSLTSVPFRYYGITRAGQLVEYALLVNVCIDWETYFQTICKTSMNAQMTIGPLNCYESKK